MSQSWLSTRAPSLTESSFSGRRRRSWRTQFVSAFCLARAQDRIIVCRGFTAHTSDLELPSADLFSYAIPPRPLSGTSLRRALILLRLLVPINVQSIPRLGQTPVSAVHVTVAAWNLTHCLVVVVVAPIQACTNIHIFTNFVHDRPRRPVKRENISVFYPNAMHVCPPAQPDTANMLLPKPIYPKHDLMTFLTCLMHIPRFVSMSF